MNRDVAVAVAHFGENLVPSGAKVCRYRQIFGVFHDVVPDIKIADIAIFISLLVPIIDAANFLESRCVQKIQPSTKEHALVSSIDLRSTYHTIAFGKRTGFLYRPTLDIPANIYNTMSSFSELILGLRNLIEESTE